MINMNKRENFWKKNLNLRQFSHFQEVKVQTPQNLVSINFKIIYNMKIRNRAKGTIKDVESTGSKA